MTNTCATGCGRPTRDQRLLCDHHVWELEQALSDETHGLPELIDQLTTTLTRQAKMTEPNGARGAEQPVPFDGRASVALNELRVVLVGWTQVLMETHQLDAPDDTLAAMGRFLLGRMDMIASHEAAVEIHDQITRACSSAWHVVDRAAPRLFVGVCDWVSQEDRSSEAVFGHVAIPCGSWLYAKVGAKEVSCPKCGRAYDVRVSRDRLWEALSDVLMTIAEIVSWGVQLEYIDSRNTKRVRNLLDQWVKRKRITAHVVNRHGRGLFPFGETLTSAMAATRKKAA
ncbi:hypothetical protein [Jiangella asiatica]|uniref:Uncharacterized protein n=1 Tax=Jiangella asiatica TaxID=2530372 RepID=A0A4R5CS98_9ACTN|nr:hypothetical protein [Jiangella asiatica]TDE03452.1 hypothetical protein E1269_20665 [Jiangella asiatica]